MATTKTHRITWDDGTERYYKLDDEDVKRWRRLADDKTTEIKSVTAASPTPSNAAPAKA